jgi:hypothetical protein
MKKASRSTKSQDAVLRLVRELGSATAYDLMPIMAAEEEADTSSTLSDAQRFAICQRVSAACSELHSDGRLHAIGHKENEDSGEQVTLYQRPATPSKCRCGNCPDGGKGYKARYEQLLETSKEESKKLSNRIDFLLMMQEKHKARIAELESQGPK